MPTNGSATAGEESKWRASGFSEPDGRNCRTLRNTCPIMADSALHCRTNVAFSAGMALASTEVLSGADPFRQENPPCRFIVQ